MALADNASPTAASWGRCHGSEGGHVAAKSVAESSGGKFGGGSGGICSGSGNGCGKGEGGGVGDDGGGGGGGRCGCGCGGGSGSCGYWWQGWWCYR